MGAGLFSRLMARLGRKPRAPVPAPAIERAQLAALEAAPNAMFITDRAGAIQWVNAAFTRLSGYALADVAGHTPRVLKSGRQGSAVYESLWRTVLAGRAWRGRLVNRRKNGEVYDVEQVVTPLADPVGKITHFLAVHEDLTPRLRDERRLLHDAMYDPVTDLPNWNLLRRRIFDAIARSRRSGRSLAVMSVDFAGAGFVDRDGMRLHAARAIHGVVRETDFVASYGDATVVVMEDFEQAQSALIPAERVLRRLAEPIPLLDGQRLQAAAGLATFPGDDASAEVLVQHAEEARRLATPGDFRFFHALR